MLNLFNLEELADVAALSFGELPDERLDSDPIIQLAGIQLHLERNKGIIHQNSKNYRKVKLE